MLSRVLSASLYGIEAHLVEVEVDVASRGLPHFLMVGLPDASVRESRDRVRAALKNVGYEFPLKPITINLAPAELRKEGAAFDLPIALGLVAAQGLLEPQALQGHLFAGELSLDGRLKPIRGALSVALLARQKGLKLVLPRDNASEAAVVQDATVLGAESLPQVVHYLRGEGELQRYEFTSTLAESACRYEEDFADVLGQEHAKRALEVAAAGGHNVLMIGPPGAGKTMLARRLPGILPPMSFEEALQSTQVHSVAGLLQGALLCHRPFRAPHHTISDVALIGGGQYPRPGEVSLAHNGVLFLDELPEFKRSVLEVLRQPLEDGEVVISRASASVRYPARFMLVAAMNPCPCGYLGDARHHCSCSPLQIGRYRSRVSGPLLDRIDIHLEVPAVPYKELAAPARPERSQAVRQRVIRAREVQLQRLRPLGRYCNAQMRSRHIRRFCQEALTEEASRLLQTALERLGLSARAHSRVLKLARTIADMEGSERIQAPHVAEAVQYRTLDRPL
jgi:magnesium chelatase family protein